MDAVLFTLSLRCVDVGLEFTSACLDSRHGANLNHQCLLFTDELPIPQNICPPNDCQLTSGGLRSTSFDRIYQHVPNLVCLGLGSGAVYSLL
jgi:hypothetical protein